MNFPNDAIGAALLNELGGYDNETRLGDIEPKDKAIKVATLICECGRWLRAMFRPHSWLRQ